MPSLGIGSRVTAFLIMGVLTGCSEGDPGYTRELRVPGSCDIFIKPTKDIWLLSRQGEGHGKGPRILRWTFPNL